MGVGPTHELPAVPPTLTFHAHLTPALQSELLTLHAGDFYLGD